MIFGKRKPSQKKQTPPSQPAIRSEDIDQLTDFLAEFLRTYGKYAFDVGEHSAEEIRTLCDEWARHALIGAATQNQESDDNSSSAKRDWQGMRRFFANHRKEEGEYVSATFEQLRDFIWSFIKGVSRSVPEEKANDERIQGQLYRLQNAAENNAIEILKQEAINTVGLLQEIQEERLEKQRQQLDHLGSHLENLRSELESARHQMTIDKLTELYNRAAFDEQIQRMADLSVLTRCPAALYMIDADHFKQVNDTFGHPIGDQVLREIANSIQRSFLRKDDFVARYGGEEFAVIIDEDKPGVAERMGERLLQGIRNLEIEAGDDLVHPTVSVGLARHQAGESIESWIERADQALYAAKQAGRDQLVVAEATPINQDDADS